MANLKLPPVESLATSATPKPANSRRVGQEQALAPLTPTHHLPQIKSNGMLRRIVQTMVGDNRAKARFYPPYTIFRFDLRDNQITED